MTNSANFLYMSGFLRSCACILLRWEYVAKKRLRPFQFCAKYVGLCLEAGLHIISGNVFHRGNVQLHSSFQILDRNSTWMKFTLWEIQTYRLYYHCRPHISLPRVFQISLVVISLSYRFSLHDESPQLFLYGVEIVCLSHAYLLHLKLKFPVGKCRTCCFMKQSAVGIRRKNCLYFHWEASQVK